MMVDKATIQASRFCSSNTSTRSNLRLPAKVIVAALTWQIATLIYIHPHHHSPDSSILKHHGHIQSRTLMDKHSESDEDWNSTEELNSSSLSLRPLQIEPREQSMEEFTAASPPQLECIPRPTHIQTKVDQRRKEGKTLIYFQDVPIKGHAPFIQMFFSRNRTFRCYRCSHTTDESRAIEADVVAVLYRKKYEYWEVNRNRIPPKYCGQLFVLVQTESANQIDPNLTPLEKYEESKVFDISSSFRLDSDLPRPFLTNTLNMFRKAKDNFVPVEERNFKFPVGWIASRCETTNHRQDYVEELMKHIGVKSYGKCLNNAQIDVKRHDNDWKAAADAQIRTHKFYLSFENSNCDYYVTEKLHRPLLTGLIPVVMGAPQAHLFLPNNHSALFVTDFDSPEALAQRMHEINNNDELFRYYTSHLFHPQENIDDTYRETFLKKQPHHACSLCDLVQDHIYLNKTRTFQGVPYTHWESCEQLHGTWKNHFQPLKTPNGIVPADRIGR